MFVTSARHDQRRTALQRCSGMHRDPMWRCPTEAVACHAGTWSDESDIFMGPNRILAFIDQLCWSRLLCRVDLSERDDAYTANDHVVTLHLNDGLFLDESGSHVAVYVVTELSSTDVTCYVSAFTDKQAAQRYFDIAVEP